MSDRSRRPVRYANQLPPQIEALIVALKRDKPHWGARKIRELLVRRLDGDVRVPAKSTVHAVLHRHGLVKPVGRTRRRATGTALSAGAAPNDLWCAVFKGEFKLGNGRYCYPLTVTDHASRFLLMCEALESTREDLAVTAFARLFAERGLPQAIRSDNGVPFASPNALFNLSKLSVWWLRLGIAIERIQSGQPQQNGRHERMHHVSYLFITHDLATVKAIAHAIVVMYQGRVVEQGAKEDILTPPHDPYTELLLSSVPEMDTSWLDHTLAEREARKARGEVVLESAEW